MEQKNSDGRIGRSKEIMLQSFQFPIISSIARYTFVIGGLQSSKTFMGSLWLLDRISKHPDCDHLITAPTTKRLNQSTKDRFEEVLPKGWLRWQEKKSQYNILFGHGIVYVRTVGDDPRALDGCTVISWLGDECGEYKKLTWEIGKARLGKENGCAFLVSNMNVPPNWVYYDCFNEFKKGNSDYVFYSVDTEQNKYFNKKLLEEEKRLLSPDDYDRKYGHRFIAMQGKVYKEFDKECDLILPARMILDGKYKILVGLDFGFNDPSAAIFVAKKDRVYYVLDEISMSGISYTEFANMIKRVVAGREYTSAESITYYADPSEKQAVAEIGSQGITPIVPGISDIRDGIRTITSLMRGRRLFFNSGLTNLFTEFEAYHYPPIEGTRYEVVKEVPVDKDNHLLDALKYCLHTDVVLNNEMGVVLATAKPEEVKEMSVEEYRKHKDDYLIKINLDRINTQRDTPYGGYYY